MSFRNFKNTCLIIGSLLAVSYAIPDSNIVINNEFHLAGIGSYSPSLLYANNKEHSEELINSEQASTSASLEPDDDLTSANREYAKLGVLHEEIISELEMAHNQLAELHENYISIQVRLSKVTEQSDLALEQEREKKQSAIQELIVKMDELENLRSEKNQIEGRLVLAFNSLESKTKHTRELESKNSSLSEKLNTALADARNNKKYAELLELQMESLEAKTIEQDDQLAHFRTQIEKFQASNRAAENSMKGQIEAKDKIAHLERELEMKKGELDDLHLAYVSSQSVMAKKMKKMELDLKNQQNKTLQLEASLKQRLGSRVQKEDIAESPPSRSKKVGLSTHSWCN